MRRVSRLGALVAAGLALIGTAFPAAAGAQTTQQLQQNLAESTKAAQDAEAQLQALQSQQAQANQALAGLTAQLESANQRVAAAQALADRLAASAAALRAQADEAQRQLDKAKSDVKRSALLLYTRTDSNAILNSLVSTDGSGPKVEGRIYLQHLEAKRHGDANRVAKLKAQLADVQAQVAKQQQDADAARQSAADEQSRLATLTARQQQLRDQAAAAAGRQSTLLSAARQQQSEDEAALTAASQAVGDVARGAGDGPALGDGTFIWPVNAPITSPFGYRTDPVTGLTAFHSGIDLGASCGTPIKAAGTGVVLSAGWNSGGYGNMTLINHGNLLSTLYGHQSSIVVSAGQAVKQGQVIGYVGSTGKSTGCHLHFEVRVDGNPVNPLPYL